MKPKALKHPFSWEERRPLILGRLLYVPGYYFHHEEFSFPGWASKEIFGNEKPVRLEYCSGNGKWIVEKALADPDSNWVAVEKRFDRVRKIWSKAENFALDNLFIICGEAETITQHYLTDASLSEIFINFPDPWPKDRHAKHRLIKTAFVKEMIRCLKDEATMTLVTDDPDYSEEMMRHLECEEWLERCHKEAYLSDNLEGYGAESYFEELWRKLGRTIRYLQYKKKSAITASIL